MDKLHVLDENYGEFAGRELKELISERKIQSRVKELGKQISEDYKGKIPIIIGVLNGSFIFFADLFRELEIEAEVDFIKISSYQNKTESSGTVRLLKDISCDVSNRDVLVVEDIIDTGLSMKFLKRRLEECNTNSVKFVTLLTKDYTRTPEPIDYIGFTVPDFFVVGYGLDLAQKLRNLKGIYTVEDSSKGK
jgi:hypoxanthine phosphoribosyltransferase